MIFCNSMTKLCASNENPKVQRQTWSHKPQLLKGWLRCKYDVHGFDKQELGHHLSLVILTKADFRETHLYAPLATLRVWQGTLDRDMRKKKRTSKRDQTRCFLANLIPHMEIRSEYGLGFRFYHLSSPITPVQTGQFYHELPVTSQYYPQKSTCSDNAGLGSKL